jgi:hypothetical protein
MNVKRTLAAGATAVAALGMTAVGFAGSAGASTTGCAHYNAGHEMQYCGTNVSQQKPALSWDVSGGRATAGNKVIAWPNSKTDVATDFSMFQDQFETPPGDIWPDMSVSFEYAPNGKPSGLVVTEPAPHAALVLERATGAHNQQFAQVTSDTLVNVATGDIVSVPGGKGSAIQGIAVPKILTGAQKFHFIEAS